MNNQFATQFLREDTEEFSAYLDSADQLVASLQPTIEKGLAAGMSKEEILDIIDQILRLNEDGVGGGSTTGGGTTAGASFSPGAGEQYATTRAFKGTRKKKYQEDAPRLAGDPSKTTKQGAKNLSAYSSVGFTKAPSAEEAGKKLKSIDVKMLWKENEEGKKNLSPEAIKLIQNFIDQNIEKELHGDFKQELAKDLSSDIFSKDSTIDDLKKFLIDKAAFFGERYTEGLNESRAYSRFKKETSMRSESERMHEAVKMIHKKLEEVSRLLEFTSQMKEELSEANDTLEYKQNTKKVFEKINKKVVEVYSKSKKLG